MGLSFDTAPFHEYFPIYLCTVTILSKQQLYIWKEK